MARISGEEGGVQDDGSARMAAGFFGEIFFDEAGGEICVDGGDGVFGVVFLFVVAVGGADGGLGAFVASDQTARLVRRRFWSCQR